MLLTHLWRREAYVVQKNLMPGFPATGLCPLDFTPPLPWLPSYPSDFSTEKNVEAMNETLINHLPGKQRRGKKVKKFVLHVKRAVCNENLIVVFYVIDITIIDALDSHHSFCVLCDRHYNDQCSGLPSFFLCSM